MLCIAGRSMRRPTAHSQILSLPGLTRQSIPLGESYSCEDRWMPGSSPGMTSVIVSPSSFANTASRSRRMFCARLILNFPPSPIRGRRECRAPDAPAALRAKVRVARTQVVTVTPESPGIPRAMVYGLFRALPGDRALLPPSFRGNNPANLSASVGALGPHDFAVRFKHARLTRHQRPPQPASRP